MMCGMHDRKKSFQMPLARTTGSIMLKILYTLFTAIVCQVSSKLIQFQRRYMQKFFLQSDYNTCVKHTGFLLTTDALILFWDSGAI